MRLLSLIAALFVSGLPLRSGASPIGQRQGLFCSDAYNVSNRVMSVLDAYEAGRATATNTIVKARRGLQSAYAEQATVLLDMHEQYGPINRFLQQDPLLTCDSDTRFNVTLDKMRYNVDSLDYGKPRQFELQLDIGAICDFRKTAARLGREDSVSHQYEESLRSYAATTHLAVPDVLCP